MGKFARWFVLVGLSLLSSLTITASSAAPVPAKSLGIPVDPRWRATTIYFIMTDRFANGDPSNDSAAGRRHDGGPLRSFEGGDIKGITDRINAGYFNALGVDAIWTTPLIENVHGAVEEGEWGKTYAYHGYWPKDWSAIDPAWGTEADFAMMVKAAHAHGLRFIMDVIVNHTGPQTAVDPGWPDDWVRTSPPCDYKSYAGTVSCELSFTLPDIRTDSEAPVALPDFLIKKWRSEGRLDRELAELDAFFKRTGYPRAPKYYIIKWLTDWVRKYGVDGFRVDTAKHTDPDVWATLKREATVALTQWRATHPDRLRGDRPFYMVGEVFNYGLLGFGQSAGRAYDYGDRTVDFYNYGFDALINMAFPTHQAVALPALYQAYDYDLRFGAFAGRATLSYIDSHDDMQPFDPKRADPYHAAEALLLAPGGVQISYGDEIARSLVIPGTKGDATLRSNFDWPALANERSKALIEHWRRIGLFRKAHLAIGAGTHTALAWQPFTFSRKLNERGLSDRVVVAMPGKAGPATVRVGDTFAEGARVHDAYSGAFSTVKRGTVAVGSAGRVILLEQAN